MIQHGVVPFLECSSKGDKRFSAFYARIKQRGNRSIEALYRVSLSPVAKALLEKKYVEVKLDIGFLLNDYMLKTTPEGEAHLAKLQELERQANLDPNRHVVVLPAV